MPSTERLVAEAPLQQLETGTRAVVEIVGYPDGQFRVVTSRVEGAARSRPIVQDGVLMFVDADEATDAIDALVDRINSEARRLPPLPT